MICSALLNLDKIRSKSQELVSKINNKIMRLFEENDDFIQLFNIFVTLIDISF